jgi:uncharacterized protein DUF4154
MRSGTRTTLAVAVLAAILGRWPPVPAHAEEPEWSPALEHQVKIGFLYNFAKFVEWPAGVLQDPKAPLVVGVLGNDPFCASLELSLQGKSVNARPIVVRRLKRTDPLDAAQILFISPTLAREVPAVLAGLRNAPVLTVSDMDRFTAMGGIINFRIVNNKVRFEINIDAAGRAGLKLSSQLLTVATVVRDPTREGG